MLKVQKNGPAGMEAQHGAGGGGGVWRGDGVAAEHAQLVGNTGDHHWGGAGSGRGCWIHYCVWWGEGEGGPVIHGRR